MRGSFLRPTGMDWNQGGIGAKAHYCLDLHMKSGERNPLIESNIESNILHDILYYTWMTIYCLCH